MKIKYTLAAVSFLVLSSAFAQDDDKAFNKAIKKGDTYTVKKMVDSTPSIIHKTDKNGYTPLHNAAYHGQKLVADHLLANGADANAVQSKHGSTPLHSAASKKCNAGVVKSLINKGADQTKVDNYGKTPLEYATQCKKKNK